MRTTTINQMLTNDVRVLSNPRQGVAFSLRGLGSWHDPLLGGMTPGLPADASAKAGLERGLLVGAVAGLLVGAGATWFLMRKRGR